MRVCVVGCGAVGSLFAAHLAGVAEVWAYDLQRDHVEAINEGGLRISGVSDVVATTWETSAGSGTHRSSASISPNANFLPEIGPIPAFSHR